MDQKSSPRSVDAGPEVSLSSGPADDRSSVGESINPRLVVVYDALQECPYLDGKVARMPLEYPREKLMPSDLDRLLELGYRRTGSLLYRTHCPDCQQCLPTRVDTGTFEITRSMKRILNRGERELKMTWGRALVDPERLRLFNEHRAERELSQNGPADLADYHEFLVATCVETAELTFHIDGKLIGIAIVDLGDNSLNAVYTHFDPDYGRYSIGTLAVLKQIQLARQTGRKYVYLGLYVADNSHLNYKRRFRPQQRLIGGNWCEPEAN